MSYTSISLKNRIHLWTISCGRCEYRDCNKVLWRDDLKLAKMNKAYIAHIIADSPDGPRGDEKLSIDLADDIRNLMLLCDEHHRTIDIEDEDGHPVDLLMQMKIEHEKRMELLTSINPNKKSHIVLFGSNIGMQNSPLIYSDAVMAVIPGFYPNQAYPIELSIKNSSIYDNEELFYRYEIENLERSFNSKIISLLNQTDSMHFSLFAIAPQPMLIKIGTLFSDITNVDVYQLHREPRTWQWQTKSDFEDFILIEPKSFNGIPILNLSLSANITNDRIERLFDKELSIWTITIKNPNNDFLKTREILSKFRDTIRNFFNKVKLKHGQDSILHVFPAMPISASIEFGRVRQPKADMQMIIYDQNNSDGFMQTIKI